MHLREELTQRWFLHQFTNEAVFDLYNQGGNKLYVGMDPTADSLHLGNFVGFMHAVQWMKRWNHLIFIVGGATWMVGDPGGKSGERNFLDEVTLEKNVAAITKQVGLILKNLTQLSGVDFSYEVKNNLDFYNDMSYLRFLREVWKYATVNQMLSKETVKRRIEDHDSSISYTEFSYMLMQAYDYLQLYLYNDCQLQIAGSDQRGNIVTWVELIRKKCDVEVFGVTCPLIVDSTGKKFGKSEWNALWLDPEKNNPYVIFQYFMNTADEDVAKYLHLLTLLDLEKINEIVENHKKDPAKRTGQYYLAYYVIQTVFGEKAAKHAEQITGVLFGSGDKLQAIGAMDKDALEALNGATGPRGSTDPMRSVEPMRGIGPTGGITASTEKIRLIDACVQSGLTESNGEAKKAITANSIYVNEQLISDIGYELKKEDFIGGKIVLLRKGKKTYSTILIA